MLKHKLNSRNLWEKHNFLFRITSEIIIERLQSIEQKFEEICYYNNGEDRKIEEYLLKQVNYGRTNIVSLSSQLNEACNEEIDPENLILTEGKLDLFITNLNMHWINDLPGFLSNVHKALKNKGVFIGAAFGRETLKQLRKSLFLMQSELGIGFSDHISPFIDSQNAAQLLSRAGFEVRISDAEEIQVSYRGLRHLFEDLKNMGENNNLNEKTIFFNKTMLNCLEKKYRENFPQDAEICASFEIIFFFGVK